MEADQKVIIPLMNLSVRRKKSGKRGYKVPLRVVRLCILSIFLPGCLIAGPLYLRFHVYNGGVYPISMSDMRLVDNKISTTWCQKQFVRSNATFNAYLLAGQPKLKAEPLQVSMVRQIDLEDDMKEYWGFYLLKGSSVTISTCSRWAGASLIVLRGHNHLKECAYFGDDSSEEQDELDEISAERKNNDGESNEPELMKRVRPGVILYGQEEENHHKLPHELEINEPDHDVLLNQLILKHHLRKNKKIENLNKNENQKSNFPELINTRLNETVVSLERDESKPQTQTSEEVFEDVLHRLMSLGTRGSRVLERLNAELDNSKEGASQDDENVNDIRQLINNILTSSKEPIKNLNKSKRDITVSSHLFHESLTKHDEENNIAIEEGWNPDGIADHRGFINETTLNDKSNSEYWSSFSSSEERLINCAGLILNLPLTPHRSCAPDKTNNHHLEASLANKLTYKVPSNGYYFFIFSSENEVQPNFIRVEFQLEKILYNVSNPVAECHNTTESCELPLNFFSAEKTVFEMPVLPNDTMWNEEYVVVTTCEPRTAIYVVCVMAVPILFLLFSF